MSRTKITLIGAGSVVFAKRLIGDILQFPELTDAEICLMDIDPQRLKVAEKTTQKIKEALQVGAHITATLDRTEAIRGADYVICTIQVGGYEPSTVRDFEIPAKYGLKQTIADTLGVGGVFRGLRTIPKILEIARDIAEVGNPECLFINYSNPMAMNCWAVDRAVGIPHVGLCHSVQGTSKQLANYIDLPYEDISYRVAGINHMAFFLRFEYRGQDAYPLLFKALEDPRIRDQSAVRFEMMRRTGYFVTESSEHQAEYVPYFIQHGQEMIDRFHIPIDEYRRRCEAIIATWQDEERKLLGEADKGGFVVESQSHEYGSYIIHACETNEQTVIYGNVPNRNLITNLTEGCCVEVPCLVDRNGIQPVRIGALPPQLAALCQSNIAVQDLTVEAALTAKREHIYHAVMMDPNTASILTLEQIWDMCDELIEAHQEDGYLGEFAPVISNTGRAFQGTGDRIIAELLPDPRLDLEQPGDASLTLVVENPGTEPVEAAFMVTLSEPFQADRPSAIELQLPPGEKVERKIPLRLAGALTESVRVQLFSDHPRVLCRELSLTPRKTFERNKDGASVFQMTLAGDVAAEGTLKKTQDHFEFRARVSDSDIQPVILGHWGIKKGSGLEVVIESESSGTITRALLLPPAEGQEPAVLDLNGKPLEDACIEVSTDPLSYEIQASLPLSHFEIGKNDSVAYIDVRCRLSALGDAHSGGATSLTGVGDRLKAAARAWKLDLG